MKCKFLENIKLSETLFILLLDEIRGQSIKKPIFFFNLLLYLQLNQTCLLQILPSTLDTPLPMFFPVLECIMKRVLREGAKVL